jgi:large subunit ribosomal protein L33
LTVRKKHAKLKCTFVNKSVVKNGWLNKSLINLKEAIKMGAKKAALACSVCGSRNYTKSVSEGKKGERLEINKFCKYCNQYTLHRETK